MSKPSRRALAAVAAAVASAAVLAGCKVVVSTGQAPSGGGSGAASQAAAAGGSAGGRHRLARISDEGKMTYSIRLTRCHLRAGGQLPDPTCTPGSVDPAVTQATIGSTICVPGYTAKVRPPESQTTRAKYDVSYPAYHVPSSDRGEFDHLVSLELGGSNDITNLWPEVGPIPNPKDKVENALHRAVCEGKVSLAAAQRAISTNWMTAESRLGLNG